MFVSEALKTHLETSATIQLRSLVLAEWNMNMPDNIFKTGNYRYRPIGSNVQYRTLPIMFDSVDTGNYYTGATNADVVVDGGFTNSGTPQKFTLKDEKTKMLYSLEDCLKPFRPRSGINKAVFFENNNVSNFTTTALTLPNTAQYQSLIEKTNGAFAQRPRYYMGSRYDQFRYWTSFRTEDNIERGIATNISNGLNYIDDAVPFVVYKNNVPANRLVVKMQTNVGDIDLGPFATATGQIADPLYGNTNKTTPVKWKIEYLKGDNWVSAISFDENSVRNDNSPIIGPDGYVDIQYGLIVPDKYKPTFIFAETLSSETLLPEKSIIGYSYLVIENQNDVGTFFIWTGEEYEQFIPDYGWTLSDDSINKNTGFVTDFTSPLSFTDSVGGGTKYREFEYIRGIRISVETMNKFDSTFDLIEMSPRLVADISDKVIEYKITKVLSDIGVTSLPVGQLLASVGQMSIFDDDQAFNENNSSSIISGYVRKNIKFTFYEIIQNVDEFDYYVPIKSLYSEGMPQADITAGTISLSLRDFFFFLESMPAPRLLLTDVSLSFAIATMLDFIGFSNYTFKRIPDEDEPIIPYFFVAPDQNVAEILNQLAISTQTAMFFDEYNNFVVMSKNYLMPNIDDRATDIVLSGSNNQTNTGVVQNATSGTLPNIVSISSQDTKVYNNGKINYTTRYIQRTYPSIKLASMIDREKNWTYLPVLLWEVAGDDFTKTVNSSVQKQSNYVLGAMPLNANLSSALPTVVNNNIVNNIMDLGENIYWLTRYQGYFYANGEIIKYDAAEFNITGTGNVWITSNQEYQRYFANLPFNGKIYPTGLVRIYSVPYYETVNGVERLKPGPVYEHGRGQFGTTITDHYAGLNSYWSDNNYVRGCNMQSQYLFTTEIDPTLPSTTIGAAGVDLSIARSTTRNSIIKNFMATSYLSETEANTLKTVQSGTIQSSALVMNGPSFKTNENPLNFVSYQYKQLDNAYKHFGARMRIIGKIESSEVRGQTPVGSIPYYQVPGIDPSKSITLGGGSGGISVLLNPETNVGYYFEIIAMNEANIDSYLKLNDVGESEISLNNVVFYKIKKDSSNSNAIPIKLWGGITSVVVDDGRFTGQYRMSAEEIPTVYDLAVEYQDIGGTRRFYLYINNTLIKVIDDTDPLPVYNNMAPFVRGSARVMFENLYALSENYAQNSVFSAVDLRSPAGTIASNASAFGDGVIDADESFRKYAMSGIVNSTYLSGLSSQQPPSYKMYYEEFGTIMRECAYFDIKYDRAYPALYAKLSPTFNRIKGYTVSGFQADSYGAEFLIFNNTDKALSLDETTGNYLRIQGITFTQDTSHELTVDEYFAKRSNFSTPQLSGSVLVVSPTVEQQKYDKIKLSRLIYGNNEFTIDSPYIQTQDDANKLMGWIIEKVMNPRKSIGINLFSIPTLQLGDIVTVSYQNNDGLDLVADSGERFVVYNIEYSRNNTGPSMIIYLSEV
jgi:hypothetical protein